MMPSFFMALTFCVLDGLHAAMRALGDLGDGQSGAEQTDDFRLPGRQPFVVRGKHLVDEDVPDRRREILVSRIGRAHRRQQVTGRVGLAEDAIDTLLENGPDKARIVQHGKDNQLQMRITSPQQ